MDIIDNLISKGWYLERVDKVNNTMTNHYNILPPDDRKHWAVEWKPVNYGNLKVNIPHWYEKKYPDDRFIPPEVKGMLGIITPK